MKSVSRVKNAIRRFFWLPFDDHSIALSSMRYLAVRRRFPDDGTATSNPHIDRAFGRAGRQPTWDYILDIRRSCFIEPKYGYAITERPFRLVRAVHSPHCRGFTTCHPYPIRLLASLARRPEHIPRVISLRDFNEANYWHFFDDILSKLLLLEEHGLYRDWPILVSRDLANRAYFRELQRLSPLLQRKIIVQDRAPLRVDRLIAVQTQIGHPRTATFLAEIAKNVCPREGARRIFLVRGKGVERRLKNEAEIARLTKRYGFDTIDTAELSFCDQVKVFRQTRHVIAAHGAGLSNIMFRFGNPMSVIELFPPDHIAAEYYHTSRHCGFDYAAILGSGSSRNGFSVDIGQIESLIQRFICGKKLELRQSQQPSVGIGCK